MNFNISNETKIGILAAVAIAGLILGFNFLKGKNLLETNTKLYTIFNKVDGLSVSNPVMINGLQVGAVYKMQERDRNMSGVVVIINLSKDIDIPLNSVASISQSLLGTSSVKIELGNDPRFIKEGDTLISKNIPGMLDQVQSTIQPTLENVNGTLQSLDSLLEVTGAYFDPATKTNFHAIVSHLNTSSVSLQHLLNEKTGALAMSLNNVNDITGNLAKNNEKVNQTMANVEKATTKMADLKLEETLQSLQTTIAQLNTVVQKANSKDGSIGLLLNDPRLYNNLQNTTRSLNILLDDLRVHPKRYINVSVFGKKDKNIPLTAPIIDTANNTPNQ